MLMGDGGRNDDVVVLCRRVLDRGDREIFELRDI